MTKREQNHELIRRIQAGDREAENELVHANGGLVGNILRKFRVSDNDRDDYHNAGLMALVRAAKKFRFDKGLEFSTYASRAVINSCHHLNRDQVRLRRMLTNQIEGVKHPVVSDNPGADEQLACELRRLYEIMPSVLTDREIQVVRFLYGFEECGKVSLESVGKMLGVTKECIRQMKLRALGKMAERFEKLKK